MIVFLSINSKVNPLLVFILINSTDLACLILTGPFVAFFQKGNAQILKEHREKVDTDPFNEALGVFAKWVKVPLPISAQTRVLFAPGSISVKAIADQVLL